MDDVQPDITDCAAEPIRIPGGIQAHGALLVISPESLKILQASANVDKLLGFKPAHGSTLHAIPGSDIDPLISEVVRWLRSGAEVPLLRTARLDRRSMQVLGHLTPQGAILEFEEGPEREIDTLASLYPRLGRFVNAIESIGTVRGLAETAAREMRELTQFNRVMVYSFDKHWNGTVLAEDGDGTLPSYLDLRFPASDIPAQARDLYRLNRTRVIPDADYVPSPIVPAESPIDRRPLDLSFAALRSVSPIHLQYMRNMQTLASMSVSIVVDGRLWGLISCHNRTPKRVNAQIRTACDFLGQTLSLQIGARERHTHATRRIELKKTESDLLASLALAESFQAGMAENPEAWLGLTGASGAAVMLQGEFRTAGMTPNEDQLRRLADWLESRGKNNIFATSSLPEHWPEAAEFSEAASGLIAASISRIRASYLMWFRREVVHTVTWAGNPQKAMAPGPDQRFGPRKSFENWKELVRKQSQPWSEAEIDSAADFRNAIVNIVLRQAEQRAELSDELGRINKELESFSYSISHDLRAPFRHIVGYAELLSEREKGRLDEKSCHYLDSIVEAAISAGKLVDDLLSFSQFGRQSLTTFPVDMKKLAKEVIGALAPEASGRKVDWRIGDLPPTRGDGVLLRQALLNLMDNALKYTRGRDPAVIEISGEDRPGETVYTVRDNGVGFDMAYVNKLFGVFQRLHRSEDFEGTGIGLAIVKRVFDRHGGWIRAEGAVEKGASFVFGLPKRTEAAHG